MIRAMIFDLDGTLVQTEKLKALSYAKAAVMLRSDLTEAAVVEAFKDVVGRSRERVAVSLLERFELTQAAAERMDEFGVTTPWQAYVQLRLQIYGQMVSDPGILRAHQWPHNMGLLRQARLACESVGLATMSHCQQVQHVLDALQLGDAFDFVATRDDVERGKPDPEIYCLVADELGFAPEECLVIEDSPAGVEAALAAGMETVAVSTPFTRVRLHQSALLPNSRIVDDPAQLPAAVNRIVENAK